MTHNYLPWGLRYFPFNISLVGIVVYHKVHNADSVRGSVWIIFCSIYSSGVVHWI